MMFSQRIQTVGSITDFLDSGEMKNIKKAVKNFNKKNNNLIASISKLASGGIAVTVANTMLSKTASAAEAVPVFNMPGSDYLKGAAKEKIIEAFMPLVEMIQALAYPVALVMLTGGALMFMINQKDRGLNLIQNASIGYILVNLVPVFMNLLVGISGTVALGVWPNLL